MAEDENTSKVRAIVRGNCGQDHSFEEWQVCKACEQPPRYKAWFQDQMAVFVEKPQGQ